MDADLIDNPRAVIGDNKPPEPTPFDLSKTEITDLFNEAKHHLDGEPVTSQTQADAIGKLMTETRAAVARAEERRKAENKPFDDGKAEVQARYNFLIGDTKAVKGLSVLTIETCKLALKPFLLAQELEKRAIAEAAQREADARRRIAQEAIRAADVSNIADRQRAEALIVEAKIAERAASRAEKDRPAVNGGGRAITSRKRYVAILADPTAAARHAWVAWRDDLEAWLLTRAQQDVAGGHREIPGFLVEEDRSVA